MFICIVSHLYCLPANSYQEGQNHIKLANFLFLFLVPFRVDKKQFSVCINTDRSTVESHPKTRSAI